MAKRKACSALVIAPPVTGGASKQTLVHDSTQTYRQRRTPQRKMGLSVEAAHQGMDFSKWTTNNIYARCLFYHCTRKAVSSL